MSPMLLLVDNGSRRAESTRNLRRLARALSDRVQAPVQPVSLLHSDRVPPDALDGRPAAILADALPRLVGAGCRSVAVVPLFFGPSASFMRQVPETALAVAREHGPFQARLAPELCPLPRGEPRLADILLDHLRRASERAGAPLQRVILVDHGSPQPAVTEVRQWLARALRERLEDETALSQAVMERRPAAEYDFNGALLEQEIERLAAEDADTPIFLSLLFLSAGRHAGPQGDIEHICRRATAAHPRLRIHRAPLVGEHPRLVDILASRILETHLWRELSPAPASPRDA